MENFYICKYCEKVYKTEKGFNAHTCDKKTRYEIDMKSIIGQQAYSWFCLWLTEKHKTSAKITHETFIVSKYYKAFIKFTEFSKKVSLVDTSSYIKYMIEKDIMPYYWCDSVWYNAFMQQFEKTTPYKALITISIKTLQSLAEEHNCDVGDIFDYIEFFEIHSGIVQRKISPMLLLKSKKFIKFMGIMNEEQHKLLEDAIDIKHYRERLKTQVIARYVRTVIEALNI